MSGPSESNDRWRTRRLRLQEWRPACSSIANALRGREGIRLVEVDQAHSRVRVGYDVLEVTFAELESRFAAGGCPPARGWPARLHRALCRYLDENARANARHRPAPCCSNPSELYTRKHK